MTQDEEMLEKIRILRDHGQTSKYHHTAVGWNCRMDGIQAAVLSVKLPHLESGNLSRRAHAERYNEALQEVVEVITPVEAPYAQHVYHVYAIRVRERDAVMAQLQENGIGWESIIPSRSISRKPISRFALKRKLSGLGTFGS